MLTKRFFKLLVLAGLVSFLWIRPAYSQSVSSDPVTVSMEASVPESVSVNLDSGGSVSFVLDADGDVNGDANPAWTTTWNLDYNTHSTIKSCVYFDSATPLAGATFAETIPSSAIKGNPGGSGTPTAITATACGQSNALEISSTTVTALNHNGGTKSDSVVLSINRAGLDLPADSYAGTLNIISIAP